MVWQEMILYIALALELFLLIYCGYSFTQRRRTGYYKRDNLCYIGLLTGIIGAVDIIVFALFTLMCLQSGGGILLALFLFVFTLLGVYLLLAFQFSCITFGNGQFTHENAFGRRSYHYDEIDGIRRRNDTVLYMGSRHIRLDSQHVNRDVLIEDISAYFEERGKTIQKRQYRLLGGNVEAPGTLVGVISGVCILSIGFTLYLAWDVHTAFETMMADTREVTFVMASRQNNGGVVSVYSEEGEKFYLTLQWLSEEKENEILDDDKIGAEFTANVNENSLIYTLRQTEGETYLIGRTAYDRFGEGTELNMLLLMAVCSLAMILYLVAILYFVTNGDRYPRIVRRLVRPDQICNPVIREKLGLDAADDSGRNDTR